MDLVLPELERLPPGEGPIHVVATTGIVGDVVSAIAGDSAEVDILMAANQDPHSYQSTAGDLQLVADADVVFVNGWRLEEGLIDDLENAAGSKPIVPVSAGIVARTFADDAQGDVALRIDPHVWLSPSNLIEWSSNVESTLIALDPDNAQAYSERAGAYRLELQELDEYLRQQVDRIMVDQRILVTNHDAFGYFADAYGFEVVGTIVPGDSTLAEPASRDLALLVEEMREASVCSIFVETSASQQLATRLGDELDYCEDVQIVELYSGALGDEGSGAETYLQMMRVNVDRIVGALLQS